MGGHGQALKPTKYHTIHDIPDELIPRYSKRDPDNKIYQTRRWVNFKKKQILFQQQDGVPNYLRTAQARYTYYGLIAASGFLFFYNFYKLNQCMKKK